MGKAAGEQLCCTSWNYLLRPHQTPQPNITASALDTPSSLCKVDALMMWWQNEQFTNHEDNDYNMIQQAPIGDILYACTCIPSNTNIREQRMRILWTSSSPQAQNKTVPLLHLNSPDPEGPWSSGTPTLRQTRQTISSAIVIWKRHASS